MAIRFGGLPSEAQRYLRSHAQRGRRSQYRFTELSANSQHALRSYWSTRAAKSRKQWKLLFTAGRKDNAAAEFLDEAFDLDSILNLSDRPTGQLAGRYDPPASKEFDRKIKPFYGKMVRLRVEIYWASPDEEGERRRHREYRTTDPFVATDKPAVRTAYYSLMRSAANELYDESGQYAIGHGTLELYVSKLWIKRASR